MPLRRFAPALFALALSPAAPAVAEAPVVVELFTSQGCSSCPPADAYLGELAQRSDVLALGWHVDYWDYIGWRDPFAKPDFTKRQRAYAERLGLTMVYTPQIVVDGGAHATGSDRRHVEALIKASSAMPRPDMQIARTSDGGWRVSVSAMEKAPTASLLWISYLPEASKSVGAGENRGRKLTNYNIVHSVEQIGEWRGDAITAVAPDIGDDALRVAAVLQARDGHVIAGARAPGPQSASLAE